MSHTNYMLGVLIAGLISLGGLILVIFRLDPFGSIIIARSLFFITLLVTLTSLFTLMGYYWRVLINRNEVYYSHITLSVRQGFLLSCFACCLLTLQIMRLFTWWNAFLLLIAFCMLELFFQSRKPFP